MKKNQQPKIIPIINIGGNVITSQGNTNIGNVADDYADFSYINQTIYQLQINQQYLQAQISNLKQDYQDLETKSNPNQLKKSLLFLAAKQILAQQRKTTIASLIVTYNQFSQATNKYEQVNTFNKYLEKVNPLISLIPVPGVATATTVLNQGIDFLTNFLRKSLFDQHSAKFEEFLMEDEKALTLLAETYNSLNNSLSQPSQINPLITNLLKINANELANHSVFAITKLEANSSLTEDNIKNAIELLTTHLQEFTQSLQSEIVNYLPQLENNPQLQAEIIPLLTKLNNQENKATDDNQKELEFQISQQEQKLTDLINSIKLKLKSKNPFSAGKITQQRYELLEQFIKTGFVDSALQKVSKDKKINLSEITDLQSSLKNLQEQLNNLQLQNRIEQSSLKNI